jgi:hypothetical protein
MDETQTKTNLTEIAATILTGLLASGDYTVSAESFPAPDKWGKKRRAGYREEVVNDAIQLTLQLVKGLALVGALPEAPQAPPAVPE